MLGSPQRRKENRGSAEEDQKAIASLFFSAKSRRSLRLCGEGSQNKSQHYFFVHHQRNTQQTKITNQTEKKSNTAVCSVISVCSAFSF